MNQKEKLNKHMTLDDRIEIQECLAKGMNFKAVGKRIGKIKQRTKSTNEKAADLKTELLKINST